MANREPDGGLFSDPKAVGFIKNKSAVEQLLKSPDTKKLMELLNKNAGGGLQNAAKAAMGGDTSAIMKLMNQVMADPEGAQAVENINKVAPK